LESHLELAPSVPLLHGHAVNIDMALTATIAENRGYITVEDRDRILGLMSRIGSALYHPLLDSDLLWYGTQSITMTRMVCKEPQCQNQSANALSTI